MRKTVIVLAAALLAIGAASQSLSNALIGSQPELAARLSPYAGRAEERRATELIEADLEQQSLDMAAAEPFAARAVAKDLLAGEALAVLAMSETDGARRQAILSAALGATRRGRVLNSAAMFAAVDAEDTDTLLTTLNRTLLLYPSQKEAMIPVMVEQLADPRMVPAFVTLLETSPDWAEEFYVQAAAQNALADNLGAVRLALPASTPVSQESDRAVLRQLARTGRIDQAAGVYARMRNVAEVPADNGTLGWADQYVPFEWQFFDQGGRFARPATDGSAVMLSVRSGFGGPLARRLIRLDGGSTFFEVNHSLDAASASRLRLSLECPDSDAGWSNPLGPSPTGMRVDVTLPCDYAWLTIEGRAAAGSPAISGELLDISIL